MYTLIICEPYKATSQEEIGQIDVYKQKYEVEHLAEEELGRSTTIKLV